MIQRIEDAPAGELGGKGAGLARLLALGLPVPAAVIVPVSDAGVLNDRHRLVEHLGEPLAVRSSAVGEDASDRSAAGQFLSVMGVRRSDLADAVRAVHASAASERVRAYLADGPTLPGMAVVIQRAVAAVRAGVAFSADPLTGEDDVVIECVFGHGEQLVSGEAVPDRYRVDRGGAVAATLAPKEGARRTLRSLRDDEVLAVAGLVRRAEAGFGHPVDVEFCFDADGPNLWLVQCRSITALRAVR